MQESHVTILFAHSDSAKNVLWSRETIQLFHCSSLAPFYLTSNVTRARSLDGRSAHRSICSAHVSHLSDHRVSLPVCSCCIIIADSMDERTVYDW